MVAQECRNAYRATSVYGFAEAHIHFRLRVHPNLFDSGMADYLDAGARGRSESVYTETSTTLASLPSSPLPIPKPPPSHLLGAQVGPKVLSNTILKSHGRPPWYCLNFASKIANSSMLLFRYGEDGQPISPAFVIGIAGALTDLQYHQYLISLRRLFQWKGLPTFIDCWLPLIHRCCIDPRRTSDCAFPWLNTDGRDHVTGSDLSAFGARR